MSVSSGTLSTAVTAAAGGLAAAGIESALADAQELAGHVLGVERGELLRLLALGRTWTPDQAEHFAGLVERRRRREPLQHLTGRAWFRHLELLVGPGVFVPRPETEQVAQAAIDAAREVAATGEVPVVVDLCTGSGALALAVADEVPGARVVALELDRAAVAWARRNIDRHSGGAGAPGARVDLRAGDVHRCDAVLLADLVGAVDVVVSNPPYIPPHAEPVDPEVRDHDPVLALYGGGDDGLLVPAQVVDAASRLLAPGGVLVMEHAEVQAEGCRALALPPLWEGAHTLADLTGRPRMLVVRRSAPATVGVAGVGDCRS